MNQEFVNTFGFALLLSMGRKREGLKKKINYILQLDKGDIFLKGFQLMASAPNNKKLLPEQNIYQFLMKAEVKYQIFYLIIRDFTN